MDSGLAQVGIINNTSHNLTPFRNTFSNLGSVVVASSLPASPAPVVDTVTRLVSSLCYHSPHLLAPLITGLAPYTRAEGVPDTISLVTTTVMAVIISEKAGNDSDLVTQVADILRACLNSGTRSENLISSSRLVFKCFCADFYYTCM